MEKYAVKTSLKQFTEADVENLEFTPEDLESLKAEAMESVKLKDINPDSVAESLEKMMEEVEVNHYSNSNDYSNGYHYKRTPSSIVNRQLLKTFIIIVRQLVLKCMNNSRTRTKLQAATIQGPTAVARLITPIVSKILPSYLRWMTPIYLPPVTLALFNPIRQEVGVKAEEVEAELEFFPLLFIGLASAARAVSVGVRAVSVGVRAARGGVKAADRAHRANEQRKQHRKK